MLTRAYFHRTANDAELKVAYRKLALVSATVPPFSDTLCVSFGSLAWRFTSDMLSMQKWHPDKNLDNPEATAVFQEIQNAYSVSTYKNDGSSSRSPFV